ncbi:MAG TPA: cbb3-type cytochrome c oxidase subunit I, partial [Candidatus Limnocylindria bacterium]|nr:cbb3-type cytochrome c oxidase subunit I [Candidatus Limnocylindria bacterium]
MDALAHSAHLTKEEPASTQPKLLTHPTHKTGLMSWLITVDHKRIGFLYGFFALCFFLVGGFEALLIRTQLMVPNNDLLTAQQYNTLFTMHGTTMIFLAIMPMSAAFFNIIMPLQIGARDVAFPRLNAFSLWTFVAGAIILNIGWFLPAATYGAPD